MIEANNIKKSKHKNKVKYSNSTANVYLNKYHELSIGVQYQELQTLILVLNVQKAHPLRKLLPGNKTHTLARTRTTVRIVQQTSMADPGAQRTLFGDRALDRHNSNASSSSKASRGQEDTEMAEQASGKRQLSSEKTKKRPAKKGTNHSPARQMPLELWLGFQAMELLALDANADPITHTMESCQHLGVPESEALEITTAAVAYPRVQQKLWPSERSDKNSGQHLHITQLPFDIVLDRKSEYALTYQILIQFERPQKSYTSREVIDITALGSKPWA